MNIFNAARGSDSLEDVLKKITANLYLFGFKNDILFKAYEMEEIYQITKKLGKKNVWYYLIDSDYGHDAFLVELEKFDYIIKSRL